jgi:hypothetical protein
MSQPGFSLKKEIKWFIDPPGSLRFGTAMKFFWEREGF